MGLYQADLEKKTYKKPGILTVGILYSIVVILFILVGYRVQKRGFYSGVLITEVILILLPPLLTLYYFKYDIKKVLRLNRIGILNLFLIFCIMIFSIPVVGLFNLANIWLVRYIFGKTIVVQPPIATSYGGLLLNILAIGLSAGVCEEVFFRGVIQRGLEKLGAATSIILTAFLFSIMHVYFEKIFGTFLLGALIGFIVYRTNSLFGGIFAHFVNNTIGVVIMFAANKLADIAKMSGIEPNTDTELIFDMFNQMPMEQLIAIIIAWAFIILFSVTILAALIYALVKNTSHNVEKMQKIEAINKIEGERATKAGLLAFLPGIMFLSVLYFLEGMTLMGIESPITGIIHKLLGV
ncbi:MAG TPA: CPBP family intramembrane metalloprotease [Clostridiaceae bacterium]|nr:CPBP family intramembrane metalloprotease [Clostridiaceae bacterium]